MYYKHFSQFIKSLFVFFLFHSLDQEQRWDGKTYRNRFSDGSRLWSYSCEEGTIMQHSRPTQSALSVINSVTFFFFLVSLDHHWWRSFQFVQSPASVYDPTQKPMGTERVEWTVERWVIWFSTINVAQICMLIVYCRSVIKGRGPGAGGWGFSPHILSYILGYFDLEPACWLHYSN